MILAVLNKLLLLCNPNQRKMANHNDLGVKGEQIAVEFLLNKGYSILCRNYRYKKWEIDIVAQFQNTLVVVEVKTRNSSFLSGPEVTVSKNKQRNLVRCANAFIKEQEIDYDTQFDIVSIVLNENEQTIEHLKDAFYPSL